MIVELRNEGERIQQEKLTPIQRAMQRCVYCFHNSPDESYLQDLVLCDMLEEAGDSLGEKFRKEVEFLKDKGIHMGGPIWFEICDKYNSNEIPLGF